MGDKMIIASIIVGIGMFVFVILTMSIFCSALNSM